MVEDAPLLPIVYRFLAAHFAALQHAAVLIAAQKADVHLPAPLERPPLFLPLQKVCGDGTGERFFPRAFHAL